MAEMAQWNGIVFQVNSEKVFTFRNLKKKYSTQWNSHDIIGRRPKLEWQGAEMEEVTLEVILSAEYGINPRKALKRFRVAAQKGQVAYFYLGGKKLTKYKMYLDNGSESWERIWNQGELVKATAMLTFKEYR